MGVWSARSGRAFALGGAVLLLAGCTGGGPSAGTGDGSAPSSGAQLTAHTEPEPPTPSTTSDPSVVPPTTEGERPDPGAAPSDGTTLGSTGDAGTVTPTITSAIEAGGTIAVSAGVSGIVEEGGTCTLRASGSDHVEVSETAVAFADASSTICEPLTVSTDRLGPRPWTVRLEYASPRHSGSSAPVEVS